jgi:hypothetical protein
VNLDDPETLTPQQMAFVSPADRLFFGGSAGGGKLLRLSEPVATPVGWSTIGDLKVGDNIFDNTGAVTQVTALSDIETPKSYRLTFDDRTSIVAGEDHRWLTFDIKERLRILKSTDEWKARRRAKRPSRATFGKGKHFTEALAQRNSALAAGGPPPTGTIRTTREIVETLYVKKRVNHAIPIAGALRLPDADLPVDPYTLGGWLGHGRKRWTPPAECTLTKRRIPPEYLRGSEAQRWSLLQGMLDSFGHIRTSGACEFDSTNHNLILDTYELITSLGIKVGMTEGRAKAKGVDYGPKWRLKFTTSKPVSRCPEKLSRLLDDTRPDNPLPLHRRGCRGRSRADALHLG